MALSANVVFNLILLFGVVMIVNGIFLTIQNRMISRVYSELAKKGEVIVGSKKGFLMVAKSMVFIVIDNRENIVTAKRIYDTGFLRIAKEGDIALGRKNINSIDVENYGFDVATEQALTYAIRAYQNKKRAAKKGSKEKRVRKAV